MTKSGHLWAIGYDDMGRAAQVRDEVIRLAEKHCLILLDMAVVVRYPDGSCHGRRRAVGDRHQHRRPHLCELPRGPRAGRPPLTGAAVGAVH